MVVMVHTLFVCVFCKHETCVSMGSSTATVEILERIHGNPLSDLLVVGLSNEMTNFSVTKEGNPFILSVDTKVGGSGRIKVVIFSLGGMTTFWVKSPFQGFMSLCTELQSAIFVVVGVKWMIEFL